MICKTYYTREIVYEKITKRLTAALLMLTMVFGLAACSMGGPKNDEAYIKNVKAGLEARWKFNDKAEQTDASDADVRISRKEAAAIELEKQGDLAEYQFADADLKALAERYQEALKNQMTGAKYYEADINKYMELYNGGYNERSIVLSHLVNDYQLSVNEKYSSYLDELVVNGEKLLHVQGAIEALTQQMASATLEHTATSKYRLTSKNGSDLALESVNIKINGMDENGKVITSGETFAMDLPAGGSISEEIYFEKDFQKAEVMLSFFYDLETYDTAYVPVTISDSLIIDLKIPDLPLEVNGLGYNDNIDNTCNVEAVDMETVWYDNKCSMHLKFSGTKTYDKEGDKHSDGCHIGWKLYDENGAVVDSGTCYTSDCMVGEKFRNSEAYVSDLEAGTYRLEIMDAQW